MKKMNQNELFFQDLNQIEMEDTIGGWIQFLDGLTPISIMAKSWHFLKPFPANIPLIIFRETGIWRV